MFRKLSTGISHHFGSEHTLKQQLKRMVRPSASHAKKHISSASDQKCFLFHGAQQHDYAGLVRPIPDLELEPARSYLARPQVVPRSYRTTSGRTPKKLLAGPGESKKCWCVESKPVPGANQNNKQTGAGLFFFSASLLSGCRSRCCSGSSPKRTCPPCRGAGLTWRACPERGVDASKPSRIHC